MGFDVPFDKLISEFNLETATYVHGKCARSMNEFDKVNFAF